MWAGSICASYTNILCPVVADIAHCHPEWKTEMMNASIDVFMICVNVCFPPGALTLWCVQSVSLTVGTVPCCRSAAPVPRFQRERKQSQKHAWSSDLIGSGTHTHLMGRWKLVNTVSGTNQKERVRQMSRLLPCMLIPSMCEYSCWNGNCVNREIRSSSQSNSQLLSGSSSYAWVNA